MCCTPAFDADVIRSTGGDFDDKTLADLQSMEVDQTWARRLAKKYGISEPMAPEDESDQPPRCSMATQSGMQRGV